MSHQKWNLKVHLLKLMIQLLNLCLDKQLFRITREHLNSGIIENIVIKTDHSVSNCSHRQREADERKLNSFSRTDLPVKSNIQ